MKNTINNGASPLLKRLLNEPNIYINLLSSGALWHVDFVNGVAKRINISDRVHDEYPFYYSDCKSIETYLLFSFMQSGFDIKIDSSEKKKKRIVRFLVPINGKCQFDSNRLSEP